MQTLTSKYLQEYSVKNGEYYAQFIDRFKASKSFISWNWAAFFFLPLWLAYRKLWKPLAVILVFQLFIAYYMTHYLALSILEQLITYGLEEYSFIDVVIMLLVFIPMTFIALWIMLLGNSLYLKKAEKAIQNLDQSSLKNQKGTSWLAVIGVFVVTMMAYALFTWMATVAIQAQNSSASSVSSTSDQTMDSSNLDELKEKLKDYSPYNDEAAEELQTILSTYNDISALSDTSELKGIIEYSIDNEKYATLSMLADKKFNIKDYTKKHGYKLVDYAFDRKKWSLLKFLLEKGGYDKQDIDLMKSLSSYGESRPLQYVIKEGDIESVRWMLKQDISLEGKFYKENSPLMLAVKAKNIEIIKLLLAKGADPDYTLFNGDSAKSLAETAKDIEIIGLFSHQ